MSADCASSVALVVNELVQNALKYAFPSGQAGRIGIELHSGRPLCVQEHGRCSPGTAQALPLGCFA